MYLTPTQYIFFLNRQINIDTFSLNMELAPTQGCHTNTQKHKDTSTHLSDTWTWFLHKVSTQNTQLNKYTFWWYMDLVPAQWYHTNTPKTQKKTFIGYMDLTPSQGYYKNTQIKKYIKYWYTQKHKYTYSSYIWNWLLQKFTTENTHNKNRFSCNIDLAPTRGCHTKIQIQKYANTQKCIWLIHGPDSYIRLPDKMHK